MRVKIRVTGDKMSSVDISIGEARRMSIFLLEREHRGPGDTIAAAAYRVEQRYGAPATMIQRLRLRDVPDMLLSNWLRIKTAYDAACARAERQAEHQEALARAAGVNEANSSMAAIAVLVEGQEPHAARLSTEASNGL